MYCSRCGKKVADDSQFCSNCGAPVSITDKDALKKNVTQENAVSDRKSKKKLRAIPIVALITVVVCAATVIFTFAQKKNEIEFSADEEQANSQNDKFELSAGEKQTDSQDNEFSLSVDGNQTDSQNNGIVEFEDFLVERCIREALGKSWDDDVTEEELSSLKELTISWKKDIALGLNFVTFNYTYTGYVNLADLKYLTGLEVLQLDFYGHGDIFENMDAIANCRQLKRLTMSLPLRSYSGGGSINIGKGYRYLKDLFAQLPALEIVDFGVTVPEPLQELLQPAESERKIVFAESENDFLNAVAIDRTGYNFISVIEEEKDIFVLSPEDVLILSSEELMRAELEEDEYEKYKGATQSVEDIFILVNSEVFDCEILANFKNLKTLVICDPVASKNSPESQVIHLETLSELPNLCSLSLYCVQVDFEGSVELPNLRELYLTLCDVRGNLGLLSMPLLKELSVVYNTYEIGMYLSRSSIWENIPELHYFHGGFFPEEITYGILGIPGDMKDATKLETLVLECWSPTEEDIMSDILSQITEELALKTLILSNEGQIDLRQIKCNDSLESFFCNTQTENLAEFINTHPNLSAVSVRSFFGVLDEDILSAYYRDVIEAAVKSPNLSMLDVFHEMELYGGAWKYSLDWMSLYEAGIYDDSLQLGAFNQNIDVETHYQNFSHQ